MHCPQLACVIQDMGLICLLVVVQIHPHRFQEAADPGTILGLLRRGLLLLLVVLLAHLDHRRDYDGSCCYSFSFLQEGRQLLVVRVLLEALEAIAAVAALPVVAL